MPSSGHLNSVNRLGDFWNVLETNLITKAAQMYGGLFWAVVKTIDFLIKLVRLLFRQLLKKLGQLFIPTSGHTTPELIKCWLFRSIPGELVPSISRNFLLTWRKSSEKRRTIRLENFNSVVVAAGSMTSIKSPNVYKSCPKVISLEK